MEIHYHDMLRIKSCGCEEAEAKMSPRPGEVKQVTMSSSAHTQALAWDMAVSGIMCPSCEQYLKTGTQASTEVGTISNSLIC